MQSVHTSNHSAARDAIFYVPEGAFNRGLADVPPHIFTEEQRRALAPSCPTGLIPLDLSSVLGIAYPATLPAVLVRYVVVRSGESLEHEFATIGEIYYVARGQGTSESAGASISWCAGDVFVLPGASRTCHRAEADSLLVCFTNEPELVYAGTRPPDQASNSVVTPAWFDRRIIDEKLNLIHGRTGVQTTAGKSVIFATTPLAGMRSILPSVTAAVNTLEPGGDQRSHRHNAAALTLAIESEGIYSKVGGERIDWIPFGVIVTPPQAEHSHHNRGPRMMKSFVVQDGALYYQWRNPGFAWTE